MAWENYPWVWNVRGVTSPEFVLLIFLADQADENGKTPKLSIYKIMRRCLLSRRSVFRCVGKLEKKGFLKRVRQYTAYRDFAASVFVLDTSRYFPKGDYEKVTAMWHQILKIIEGQPGRVVPPDYTALRFIREAFHQRNTRVIYLVTETDVYEEAVFRNLTHLKNAAVELKLPIRRFECFSKPRIEAQQRKLAERAATRKKKGGGSV